MAGALEAAEGQFDAAGRAVGIDEDLARDDLAQHRMGGGDIRGPYARNEAIVGAIGKFHRLGGVPEGGDGQYRAEHFFLPKFAGRIDMVDQRRLHEESVAIPPAAERLSPEPHPSPPLAPSTHRAHPPPLPPPHDRPAL